MISAAKVSRLFQSCKFFGNYFFKSLKNRSCGFYFQFYIAVQSARLTFFTRVNDDGVSIVAAIVALSGARCEFVAIPQGVALG